MNALTRKRLARHMQRFAGENVLMRHHAEVEFLCAELDRANARLAVLEESERVRKRHEDDGR